MVRGWWQIRIACGGSSSLPPSLGQGLVSPATHPPLTHSPSHFCGRGTRPTRRLRRLATDLGNGSREVFHGSRTVIRKESQLLWQSEVDPVWSIATRPHYRGGMSVRAVVILPLLQPWLSAGVYNSVPALQSPCLLLIVPRIITSSATRLLRMDPSMSSVLSCLTTLTMPRPICIEPCPCLCTA